MLITSTVEICIQQLGQVEEMVFTARRSYARHPSKFQRVSHLGLIRYCSDVVKLTSSKLCTMFGRLLGWYTMYTFLGALAL